MSLMWMCLYRRDYVRTSDIETDFWDTPYWSLENCLPSWIVIPHNDLVSIFIFKCLHEQRMQSIKFLQTWKLPPALSFTKPGLTTVGSPKVGRSQNLFSFSILWPSGQAGNKNVSRRSSCVCVAFTCRYSSRPSFSSLRPSPPLWGFA